MDRRSSLKTLAFTSVSAGLLLDACKTEPKKAAPAATSSIEQWDDSSGREPFEVKRDEKLMSEKFFTDHEMKTIEILADIIIPKDDKSGSATDSGVPDFIEFIVKDMPEHQTPVRGGLRWLDLQCMERYNNAFANSSQQQQMQIVDEIAWPSKAKPEMHQGVAFFSLMRNLTASGFYSSKIGIADMGYAGNTPNVWDGVPADVLKQYGIAYDQKILDECVKAGDHNKLFTFS